MTQKKFLSQLLGNNNPDIFSKFVRDPRDRCITVSEFKELQIAMEKRGIKNWEKYDIENKNNGDYLLNFMGKKITLKK